MPKGSVLPIRILGKGPWYLLPARTWSVLTDFFVFALGLSFFYVVVVLARTWFGPFNPHVEISRSPDMLPVYAAYSLLRILVAYALSLAFTLVYGYVAAYNAKAERFMIPLLDILQSIPVLSFLPGVMLAMVALFPHHQLGVELGAILLIFTGQVWNMAFSFYSSLKSIPRDMREAAKIYQFNWYQRFTNIELPYSAIGLVWNSMMSVAGGWFFLMACEMFVLGDKDFRLPGLGSYLQTAASNGNTRALLWGVGAMVAVIVLMDQLIWRPVITWADKFKFEQVESSGSAHHSLLNFIRRESILIRMYRRMLHPVVDWMTMKFASGAKRAAETIAAQQTAGRRRWMGWVFAGLGALVLVYGVYRTVGELAELHRADYYELLRSAGITFLRVNLALLIGAVWTIPVGVAIGFSPRLARLLQPLALLAASIPATALFPVILLFLIRLRGGIEIAAMLLMLLGTQWYILFNVIAGA